MFEKKIKKGTLKFSWNYSIIYLKNFVIGKLKNVFMDINIYK